MFTLPPQVLAGLVVLVAGVRYLALPGEVLIPPRAETQIMASVPKNYAVYIDNPSGNVLVIGEGVYEINVVGKNQGQDPVQLKKVVDGPAQTVQLKVAYPPTSLRVGQVDLVVSVPETSAVGVSSIRSTATTFPASFP